MEKFSTLPANSICFGLDRATDEQSITTFLQRFAKPNLLEKIVPLLEDHEIEELLASLSSLMAKYLTESQYHRLFLTDC